MTITPLRVTGAAGDPLTEAIELRRELAQVVPVPVPQAVPQGDPGGVPQVGVLRRHLLQQPDQRQHVLRVRVRGQRLGRGPLDTWVRVGEPRPHLLRQLLLLVPLRERGGGPEVVDQHVRGVFRLGRPLLHGQLQHQAERGGALLRGIDRDAVERGQVLSRPGIAKPHRKFRAEVYVLTREEGGRHKPFFPNYRPQFYFRTTDVTGHVSLPEGTEMVMPGDNTEMTVQLQKPIAMDEGLRFAIREGGRTVGSGRVVKIEK